MVNKLAPCANSQQNESLNSTIGFKNPKTRFYGGSESNNFRVACGVAQTNIGYDYIGQTLEALLSLVTTILCMLVQWTGRLFVTNNEKEQRNSSEGVITVISTTKFTNIKKESQRRNHMSHQWVYF